MSCLDIADLSELIKLHGKSIYGFCYKLTKDKTDTDELYQETFLKAIELCRKIDKDNNPKAFLISIAIGIWKNKRRKYAWRQRIAPTQELNEDVNDDYIFKDELTLENIVISNELRVRIQTAVDTLNDKLRIPLYMYYTAEMSIQDIASALKIPQGTVKSRLYKARKALKNILKLEE
ncbi:RNA polymerase sigma factor [Crassaminicella profunda]|uniref:RNA polymerase sigma factor n=1 Tax=Crassaminicella profunda TaxID=1286698 RepID=UPI001FEBCA4D|nr:RNA polymerase sigma factor [Crassaminicella profunda]